MLPVDLILARLEPGSMRPHVVLIDGFSGAGKTTLAALLVEKWASSIGSPVQLLHLEDVYPGWDGLDAANEHVVEHVLAPLQRGDPARWRTWDWEADAAAGWNAVDARSPLVIEGAGSLSAAARGLASLGVWIELDAETRKARALARDGNTFAPHWERWARQELRFSERERSRAIADLVLDGAGLSAEQ